ncbi:ArnT family glycosyltransferase [Nitratiruptor tergarcus]|uniref:4-amino-4-deoxy-L-arabinose transferase and related glycosyltransferases of PMT family n=1 Tax=Nitratiruptor tergarcus DSM 16512 TaxID=1069081 RepID=A0A1W1WTB0_9BACT|nr:glycosyltransferase family 39 protein [Nitratiruptor tergarcus]SMC09435.1 4-amino-4-deoxy-L-arabinose transferase and related glycosyltransferases of PMT family [Nitratiruptor tergarcus DSM 16512]
MNLKNFLFIILIITFYRAFILLHSNLDLYVDEAYYWGWSKDLAFGYYSKPPMIAWVIALFTHLCGDSQFCIKLPALLLYPVTSIFVYLIAKELFDKKVAFWSGVVFITLPAVSMSSLIISTDVVLLLFWSMTLYFFIKAIKTNKTLYWTLAAISAGAGLLSKYTMILFVLSVFLYLFLDPRYKKHLFNPKLYLTIIGAALLYFPNLIWNMEHQYITFVHTKNLSGIEKNSHFHFQKVFEFLAAQFLVFGPVFFATFLYMLKFITKKRYTLLFCFSLPFIFIITLQAFLSKALANWAAPTYVAATILVTAYLIHHRRILYTGIIINLLLAFILYHYHDITKALHIELTSKTDPYKRVLGYKELAKKLQPIIAKYPGTKLLFDDRTTMAEMIYYLKPHPFDAIMFNPQQTIGSQYHLTTDLNNHLSQNFLYITKKDATEAAKYFTKVTKVATITIPLYKDYSRHYNVYYLENFKGY